MKILALAVIFFGTTLLMFADKAEEIMEKSVKAAGGIEKFDNISTIKFLADMKIPAQNLDLKITFRYKKPDKMRFITEIPAMFTKVEAGTNGKEVWSTMPPDSVKTLTNEPASSQILQQLDLYKGMIDLSLKNFKERDIKFSFKEVQELDSNRYNVIEFHGPDSTAMYLYFNVVSNLLYAQKQTAKNNGSDYEVVTKIKEYQKVDGIIIPKKIEVYENNVNQAKITISQVNFTEVMDDKEFNLN